MRHGKSFNHLSRTSAHRKSLLSNMAISLIKHKRITTTLAKARELRKYVEPIITRSKEDTTHNRRLVFAQMQDKETITELFNNISEKVATRPGGYTRIVKLGTRPGDGSDMAMIELVDFNELLLADAAPAKKTRRSRRGSGAGQQTTTTAKANTPAVEDAQIVEDEATQTEATADKEAALAEDTMTANVAETSGAGNSTEEVGQEMSEPVETESGNPDADKPSQAEGDRDESTDPDAKEQA